MQPKPTNVCQTCVLLAEQIRQVQVENFANRDGHRNAIMRNVHDAAKLKKQEMTIEALRLQRSNQNAHIMELQQKIKKSHQKYGEPAKNRFSSLEKPL